MREGTLHISRRPEEIGTSRDKEPPTINIQYEGY